MKRKIISTLAVCAMTVSMSATAFATGQQPASLCFNKEYKIQNGSTENPAETFAFTFANGTLTYGEDSSVTVPALSQVSTTFSEEAATTSGLSKSFALGLERVNWPSVGIYTYDIAEVKGSTAGVTYDSNVYKMDVLVEFVNGVRKPVQVTFYDASRPSEKKTAFTNLYSAGSLAVTKEVTGNMGEKNKDFSVDVTFHAPQGEVVKSTISYVDDSEEYSITADDWSNGSCTVTIDLKDSETVTFENIPYGVTYAVVEDDYTSTEYDAAVYTESNGTANDGNGTIQAASDSVKITNNKEIGISTGIVMDIAPYIIVLFAAAAGLIVFLNRKRIFGSNS